MENDTKNIFKFPFKIIENKQSYQFFILNKVPEIVDQTEMTSNNTVVILIIATKRF